MVKLSLYPLIVMKSTLSNFGHIYICTDLEEVADTQQS
jgi:hypothetical protein